MDYNNPNNPVDLDFGQAPVNAQSQLTWSILYDVAVYTPGAVLNTQRLFDASQNRPLQYRSGTFQQLGLQKNIAINGMRVSSSIILAQRSSEPLAAQDWYFNEFSYFAWTIIQKNYDQFKLADLLPYKLTTIGGTVTTVTQDYPYFILPELIKIPSTGDISLSFVPADGVTAAASGVTNPQLPNLGLTSNYGFALNVVLMGSENRPIS